MPDPRMLRNGLMTFVAAAVASLALLVPSANAYDGEFCYGIYLNVNKGCDSNQESNLRRAIGHGADYTLVMVFGDGPGGNFHQASDQCYSDGCGADTGYLPVDVTGNGSIENSGDPCNCGGGYYYGWLYP